MLKIYSGNLILNNFVNSLSISTKIAQLVITTSAVIDETILSLRDSKFHLYETSKIALKMLSKRFNCNGVGEVCLNTLFLKKSMFKLL